MVTANKSWIAAGAAVLFVVARPAAAGSEPPIAVFPVAVAVAQQQTPDGLKPAADDAWIDAQIAIAERLFGPTGVHLKKSASRVLDARFAHLETRRDRDALAGELTKGAISVFVVASLRDVDDPSLFRMGVHWRPNADNKKHYVIIAANARESSLAHEIGHFFGNGHSQVENNVMSYKRTSEDLVFFDAVQGRKIKNFARIYLRTKELVPLLSD
jgi:hypothetical protein